MLLLPLLLLLSLLLLSLLLLLLLPGLTNVWLFWYSDRSWRCWA